MKKKLFTISLVFLLFCACQNVERTERPEDLIAENKMVDVLTELAILQSARNLNRNVLEEAGIHPEEYIYEKYDIDSLQFQNSNDYYSENFVQYERIYEQVRDRLEAIKRVRDSIQEEEVRIEDSIARLDSISRDSISRDSIKELREDISRDSLGKSLQFRRNR
ncbi:DUF4296 domain-containing protein [Zunongwangia sp. F363]|uniref:DUF4296 domain-containing protein n=1 Tax=Autumnicola tepida TaxID=3075595 RepID=A0ABU3CAQ7_9FLAO|nr:DUF4296 domain-containing protein [Zunongwangia sp. F363]MDT0643432.1 DUF4296 domain-containing protein [Zunongwangia sp. F363]